MMLDLNKYNLFDFNKKIEIAHRNYIIDQTINLNVKNEKLIYNIESNEYSFILENNKLSADKENIIIILSKDNGHILDYSLKRLYDYNINHKYDILLVDDRSITQDIYNLSQKYSISYLRIENKKNIFNYSVLNNIATLYAKFYNKKRCIFYNNDLWPKDINTIDNLLVKHQQLSSDITGCKLLYPSEKEYNDLGKPQHILSKIMPRIYGTIQHGGIYFTLKQSPFVDSRREYMGSKIVLAPMHQWRFYHPNHSLASYDTQCFAVTGAFQIIDIDKFIAIGGFTTSLPTSFQDIDLCFKALEQNMKIYYIGSESMVHAESLTHHRDKITSTSNFISDNLFWDAVWGYRTSNIIGYKA